jgi:transposase InsO family protein
VEEADRALRIATYERFVAVGRAPTAAEMSREVGLSVDATLAGWRRLHDQHALVLDAAGEAIRMANPFSAVPTPYRVDAAGRSWFANCAWDAFGVCAALDVDGRIETSCADCGDPLAVDVADRAPAPDHLVFHCLVPAARWWQDIVFT